MTDHELTDEIPGQMSLFSEADRVVVRTWSATEGLIQERLYIDYISWNDVEDED